MGCIYDEKFPVDLSAILTFKERKITGPQFYEEFLDGVFCEDDLNSEGNAFAMYYFDLAKGQYIYDYIKLLAKNLPSEYYVKDTWENYKIIKKRIDQRYVE